jgi:hypothetical protein
VRVPLAARGFTLRPIFPLAARGFPLATRGFTLRPIFPLAARGFPLAARGFPLRPIFTASAAHRLHSRRCKLRRFIIACVASAWRGLHPPVLHPPVWHPPLLHLPVLHLPGAGCNRSRCVAPQVASAPAEGATILAGGALSSQRQRSDAHTHLGVFVPT